MEPAPRNQLARERARERRAKQVQRRRLVLGVGILALIILIAALAIGLSGDSDTAETTSTTGGGESETTVSPVAATYTAYLTGADSVPSVETEATGGLTLTYDPDTDSISFVLELDGLTNPSSATIYEGASGESGNAVVTIFAGPTDVGLFRGQLAEGEITAADLTGTLAGKSVADLVALIKDGRAYVSVGNTSHPVDAIRGRIM